MPAAAASNHYCYTLRQLAPRDELVFKSVVRVLQGKTRHQWQHTEDRQAADLVLMGDHLSDFAPLTEDLAACCVIHVSATAGYGFHGLSLPLRIGDVIARMDKAGDEIARRAALRHPVAQPAPAPLQDGSTDLRAQRVSLTRWPEAALLQRDIRFLKLATVLTGQPLSIVELAARTQFPIQLCQGFVDSLKAGQLVRVSGDGHEVTLPAPAPTVINYGDKPEPAHHGLIARIRSRLEMFVGTAAPK